MKSIALLGYSGHSYVIADSIIENGDELTGYYDITESLNNPFDLMYLGNDDSIIDNHTFYFPAVGSNSIRKKLIEHIQQSNCKTINIIHPKASISKKISIGTGNFISASVRINTLVNIKDGCIINTGAIIEHECFIDNYCHIAPGAVLAGNVKVGSLTFIGANSVIKEGISIGSNVIIGAGSTVINDIPDNQTWVGSPAKRIV